MWKIDNKMDKSGAAGMAALALLAVQTQPWYLLWALAPAAATDRPRLHALLGWGCVVLAMLVPPTGGDFLLRGYQLTNAIAAAALLLLAWAGIGRFLGCAVQASDRTRGHVAGGTPGEREHETLESSRGLYRGGHRCFKGGREAKRTRSARVSDLRNLGEGRS